MADTPSELMQSFHAYSAELDEHYDRRERIIKTSRDITALSKKLIFHLHRVTQRKPEAVLKEAQPKLQELENLFKTLQDDLEGERYWRYSMHSLQPVQGPTDTDASCFLQGTNGRFRQVYKNMYVNTELIPW